MEKNAGKKLVVWEDAEDAVCQHDTPCSDCPWRRDSAPGWLGSMTPREWTDAAHHSNTLVDCHTMRGAQCAGIAIYRRNVCQRVDPPSIRLEADRETVFANRMEFESHHSLENETTA